MPKSTSTVDTTKTTTSTSSKQSGARRKSGPITGPSALEQAANKWATLTPAQQNTFAQLTNTMVNAKEPSLPTRRSAYNTYVALSAANIAADKPLDTTAKPYTVMPALPPVTIHASSINGTLKITITPDVAYPHAVALKAARPVLADTDIYSKSAYKSIGAVPDFSGTVDITALYLSRYRVSGPGLKIALELMGVAPGGFHTSKLFVFGLVGSTAEETLLAEPEQTQPEQTEPELGKLELG